LLKTKKESMNDITAFKNFFQKHIVKYLRIKQNDVWDFFKIILEYEEGYK
jgi:hypothetical protein